MNKHFNSLSKCSQKLQVKSQLAKPLISIYSPVIFMNPFIFCFEFLTQSWISTHVLPSPSATKKKLGASGKIKI